MGRRHPRSRQRPYSRASCQLTRMTGRPSAPVLLLIPPLPPATVLPGYPARTWPLGPPASRRGRRTRPRNLIVPQDLDIGAAIEDLLIIWAASDADELRDDVLY